MKKFENHWVLWELKLDKYILNRFSSPQSLILVHFPDQTIRLYYGLWICKTFIESGQKDIGLYVSLYICYFQQLKHKIVVKVIMRQNAFPI